MAEKWNTDDTDITDENGFYELKFAKSVFAILPSLIIK